MLPDVEADGAKLPWYWSLPNKCLLVIGLDEEIAASSMLSRGVVPWQPVGIVSHGCICICHLVLLPEALGQPSSNFQRPRA